MEFEWDETKRKENLRKHGLDFLDAPTLFNGPMLVQLDTREHYGEPRFIGLGVLEPVGLRLVYYGKAGFGHILSSFSSNRMIIFLKRTQNLTQTGLSLVTTT